MANYTYGVRAVCSFYIKESEKTITCEGVIPGTTTMTRFETKDGKRAFQCKHCERYDAEGCCPIAKEIQNQYEIVDGNNVHPAERKIGQRIKAAREAAHMSQRQLAVKSFVSRSHIGDIERGRARPSIETLELFSEALGVKFVIGRKRKEGEG